MIEERRAEARGRLSAYANPFYRALRASAEKADTLIGALGIFLVAGLIVAAIGTAIFVSLASHVRSGSTQAFDDAVIRWIGAHRSPGLDAVMVEVTTLGTGIVVIMIVAVAALFLVLTQHKYSAILLLASTIGGIVLDGILKLGFNRSRPAIFIPAVHTVSSSFPSGHAMSAAVVYSTVAYLAARLHKRRWARWLVMTDARSYSEVRDSPRSPDSAARAPRSKAGCVRLALASLTSASSATFSTKTCVSSSTLS